MRVGSRDGWKCALVETQTRFVKSVKRLWEVAGRAINYPLPFIFFSRNPELQFTTPNKRAGTPIVSYIHESFPFP